MINFRIIQGSFFQNIHILILHHPFSQNTENCLLESGSFICVLKKKSSSGDSDTTNTHMQRNSTFEGQWQYFSTCLDSSLWRSYFASKPTLDVQDYYQGVTFSFLQGSTLNFDNFFLQSLMPETVIEHSL